VALPATDGSYGVTVQAADSIGNLSPVSAPVTVVVDRTGPSSAPTTNPLPSLTSAASVTVAGATEANATVTISVTGMAPVITTADASGNYSTSVALPATDGSYGVTVQATDVAGNDSPASSPLTVVVDRTAPASAPTVSPALPALTNAASVTVAGVTEPNATVTVFVDGALAVTTTANGAGAYSVATPLPPADATYAVTVRAADPAGNLSPVSAPSSVTLDRTAPAPAVIDAPAPGASLPPGTISITGSAEPGATITATVDGVIYTAIADTTTGAFQIDVSLADGNHFVTVTATDAAGNVSDPADRSFVVTTPPAAGGGGCGCGPGAVSGPEALLLAGVGLLAFRRRRPSDPANLPTR
jgi:MYXO-CTERM domain-containing protein